MKKQDTCSFFVSNAHLLTIIVPYINDKINEGKNVNIISQIDLNDDIKKYLKSVKEFNNKNIKNICWESKNINNENIIFLIGDRDFIEMNCLKYNENEVVKCYELEKVNNMENIIEENDYYW